MQVTRWRRYGKDRLYVRDDEAGDIGWWDLATDEAHPVSPSHDTALAQAVGAWRAGNGGCETSASVASPVPVTAATEPRLAGPVPPDSRSLRSELAQSTEDTMPAASAFRTAESPDATTPVSPLPVSPAAPVPAGLEWVDGVAGGSASSEFQRRHDARHERVTTAHPKIGKFLLAVFDDPQSTRAWSVGADGESALGGMLARMAGPELRVLHDRRIPRTTANIDHVVVCPTGVWVIDAKRYVGSRPALRVEGGILRPRTELLTVGGRDRTKLVDGMHKQLSLVRTALADQPEVTVRGVLCFVDADWPVIGGDFVVRDVAVVWPKKLAKLLVQPGPLDPDRIAALQWQLHEAFPRHRDQRPHPR
ncbi:MAG TPA: NERD domain-containing protein [Propionibacteriaceae bacterium]|nr:NERD domain-containing protein [Propionibacteriaceae bacterium]